MESAKHNNPCQKFPCPLKTAGSSSRHSLEILIEIVLGLIVIVSFSLFTLLSIPIYLFRFAVIIFAKYFRKDLDDIFNGISSFLVNDYFGSKPPRANAVVQIIIRGHVTLEELKHLVKSRWMKTNDERFKNFCQYPVRWMGFTFYKKDATASHVDNHVYLYPEPEQGIIQHVNEEDVTTFSEKLLNSPFTPFKSPWEVHLVQNYKNEKISPESEKLSVFVLKVHHSLTDGFGVMAALVQAFSQQTLADLKIPKPRYPKTTWWKNLTRCIFLSFKLIPEIGRFAFQALIPNPWKVTDEKKKWCQISFRLGIHLGSVFRVLCTLPFLLEYKNACTVPRTCIKNKYRTKCRKKSKINQFTVYTLYLFPVIRCH